ncbi:MAG: helix-hairpin-helix domain-containing protein [Candidatus Omnitrophota bacterium]
MIKLERLERVILIFLISALILGVAISAVLKARSPAKVTIGKFNPEDYKNAQAGYLPPSEKININTANIEDLMKIKGVGQTIASRIIEYRYQKGRFVSIDDLKNVKGVSVALFEKIRDRLETE